MSTPEEKDITEGHRQQDDPPVINRGLHQEISNDESPPVMTEGARLAAEAEKAMTCREALRTCLKGILWAILFASSTIMEGFDLALLSGFYAYPAFRRFFGEPSGAHGSEEYEVAAKWQTGLSAGAQVGQIIGLLFAGAIAHKLGYKKTMIGALSLLICFIFVPFFASSKEVFLFGEIMQGLSWGVFEAMPAAYAAEIVPLAMRAYITTYSNLCWVIGQLLATGVLRGFLTMDQSSNWSFRIPLALQWVWPVPILLGILLAPESPWWLEKKGRSAEARAAIRRATNYSHETADNMSEYIRYTVRKEEAGKESKDDRQCSLKKILGPYLDCFRGVDRRRTEISCGTWISQSLCGSNLMAFAPVFFRTANLSTDDAFNLQLGALGLGALGTVLAWGLMARFGRRTIYISGLATLLVLLVLMGVLAVAAFESSGVGWGIAALFVVYTFVYDSTVGPCCYSIVTEIPSVRLRAATVSLARISYNLCGIFSVVMNPQMLNKSSFNWGPRAALFWAGLCACCCFWAFWRLPEPKDRSFGELDILFQQKVKARYFSATAAVPSGPAYPNFDSPVIEENVEMKGPRASSHLSSVNSSSALSKSGS